MTRAMRRRRDRKGVVEGDEEGNDEERQVRLGNTQEIKRSCYR